MINGIFRKQGHIETSQDRLSKFKEMPADVILNLEIDFRHALEKPDRIVVYNELGQVHKIIAVRGRIDFQSIDVRDWSSGIYTFILMSNNAVLSNERVVIAH